MKFVLAVKNIQIQIKSVLAVKNIRIQTIRIIIVDSTNFQRQCFDTVSHRRQTLVVLQDGREKETDRYSFQHANTYCS